MNKLGAGLFFILLVCGALLWTLAPESFNQYVKQEIETLSSSATGYVVTTEKVTIQAEQGYGRIEKLMLLSSSKQPALQVDEIIISVNPKTLKTNAIVINQLEFTGITFLSDEKESTHLLTQFFKQPPLSKVIESSEMNEGVTFSVKSIVINNVMGNGKIIQDRILLTELDKQKEKLSKAALTEMIISTVASAITSSTG